MRWTRFFVPSVALLLTAFALPDQLLAQHATKHHHYKFIDLGTLGGPNSGVSIEPWTPAINSRGTVAGFADTSIPTSAAGCYNPVGNPDCYQSHAFVWRGGELQDLGTLPGGDDFSSVYAINQSGQIVGVSENGLLDPVTGNPEFHAVLWDHDNILDLGTLGGVSSFAGDINDRGQVVGPALNAIPDPNSMLGNGSATTLTQTRGFFWEHGRMQDLGTLGGTDTWPVYVNDRGQVAGTSYTSDSIDPNTGLPPLGVFLWENGKMINIGSLGGDNGLFGPLAFNSIVFGLNNRGEIAGYMVMPDNQTVHAFLWDGKKLKDLGTLGGSDSWAYRINDNGDVVGNSFITPGDNLTDRSFLWRNGAMLNLGTTGGYACNAALAVNASAQVVGALTSAVDGCAAWRRAFLWEKGDMVDLNTLIPPGSSLNLNAALDINDRGEIVAGGQDPSCTDPDNCDYSHAALLIPCDEAHPGIKDCDYSMVEATAAVTVENTHGVAPSGSAINNLPFGSQSRLPGLAKAHRFPQSQIR